MAENGKIIRNGAEIQIDENGNVVARPATGQEFIVEDDAVVGTLEADRATIKNGFDTQVASGLISRNRSEHLFFFDDSEGSIGENERFVAEFDWGGGRSAMYAEMIVVGGAGNSHNYMRKTQTVDFASGNFASTDVEILGSVGYTSGDVRIVHRTDPTWRFDYEIINPDMSFIDEWTASIRIITSDSNRGVSLENTKIEPV